STSTQLLPSRADHQLTLDGLIRRPALPTLLPSIRTALLRKLLGGQQGIEIRLRPTPLPPIHTALPRKLLG
ncbi:hypothetical protein, partial [Nocardia brasiliensis]|uniref:hypothetical protein n=1 Tax=Nocardia brasiliensis TaxID=37326 RepID=UPI0024564FAE